MALPEATRRHRHHVSLPRSRGCWPPPSHLHFWTVAACSAHEELMAVVVPRELPMAAMAGELRAAVEKDLRVAAMAGECRAAAEEELQDMAVAEELWAAAQKELRGDGHGSSPRSNLTIPSSIRQHRVQLECGEAPMVVLQQNSYNVADA
ncbi:unnamed protein product [Urochloa humidicola]